MLPRKIAGEKYYDKVGNEHIELFMNFPEFEQWYKELCSLVMNKFKELDLSKVAHPIVKTETFEVQINKEDLE